MSIPYDQFAEVNPSVLSAAGSNVSLAGLVLTQNSLATDGVAVSYASADAVGTFFGFDSDEYKYAVIYFTPPTGSTKRPAALLIAGCGNPDDIESTLQAIKSANSNLGTIATVWQPSAAEIAEVASWTSGQSNRYAYVPWYNGLDASGATDTTSPAYLVSQANDDGTIPVFGDYTHAAAVQSWAASIDWDAQNGRSTLAFKEWSGLVPYVSDATAAENLIANGYNFYGIYGANGNSDDLMRNGTMVGQWKWADSYINQIYLNAQLQYAVVQLFKNSKSIPYNSAGNTIIRAALKDPIDSAINFGSIRTGVTLSSSQAANIEAVVGSDVSSAIYSDGYYLYIATSTAAQRAARTSPTIYFWYADGGSVQSITIASVEVQ